MLFVVLRLSGGWLGRLQIIGLGIDLCVVKKIKQLKQEHSMAIYKSY